MTKIDVVRPRRSALYMPGSNARALEKAKDLPADVLVLDLEDAVAPTMKEAARNNIATALHGGGYSHKEIVVRINGSDTPWCEDDLDFLIGLRIDAVLLPKVESAKAITDLADFMRNNGFSPSVKIWAMIETPRAFFRLEEIAASSPLLKTLVLGTTDLVNEMRARHTDDRIGITGLLSQAVAAARAFGLSVLDGVHLKLDDEEGLQTVCEQGRDMGFDGKTLIHPKQIAAANQAFGISEEQAEEARRLIEAYENAKLGGAGIVVLDGKLVEIMHVDNATRTIALWEATSRR